MIKKWLKKKLRKWLDMDQQGADIDLLFESTTELTSMIDINSAKCDLLAQEVKQHGDKMSYFTKCDFCGRELSRGLCNVCDNDI